MKVNDLMLGDWVYNRVADITFQVYPQFFGQWHNRPEQFEAIIQPIPLTAEILEKNGFEKDPESGELIWTDDDVTEVVWVGTILTIRGESANAEFATCMFVHQLQHALRLCGIEHEITL